MRAPVRPNPPAKGCGAATYGSIRKRKQRQRDSRLLDVRNTLFLAVAVAKFFVLFVVVGSFPADENEAAAAAGRGQRAESDDKRQFQR